MEEGTETRPPGRSVGQPFGHVLPPPLHIGRGFVEFDYFDSVHSGISRILSCVARRAPGPFATGSAASLQLVVAR